MRRRDEPRLVEVVLDEVPFDDGSPARHRGPADPGAAPVVGPGTRGSTPRRRRRGPVVAAAAVAVVTLLAAAAVDARADRREREALAAHADVPGVVDSLAEPLAEVWRLPPTAVRATAPDVFVTVDEPDVVGRDSATGETRWTVGPVRGRVACPLTLRRQDGSASSLCGGGLAPRAPGLTLAVLDPRTGDLDGRVRGSGLVLAAGAVDGDLALVEPGAGVGLTVARLDVLRDRVVWRVPIEDYVLRTGVRLLGDRAVLTLEAGTTVVLDARDGRELARLTATSFGLQPSIARSVSHPGAGFGLWRTRTEGRWYRPDGTPGPRLDGEPVQPEVDDGSVPGVLLLRPARSTQVRAVDVATGRERWARPAPDRALLLLDGRLVVSGAGRLEGWDLATGEVAWSVRLDAGDQPHVGEPLTDGVRVLVGGEDAGGRRLTAYRIADGARVWRSTLPAGTNHVAVLGDRLAAVGRFEGRGDTALVLG